MKKQINSTKQSPEENEVDPWPYWTQTPAFSVAEKKRLHAIQVECEKTKDVLRDNQDWILKKVQDVWNDQIRRIASMEEQGVQGLSHKQTTETN